MGVHNGSSKVPILCLGAPRSGTASLGEALRILGYKSVHHGTNMHASDPDWPLLSAAADATFATLLTYDAARAPFTRSDWDALLADRYDAVTDVFSYFAISLLNAYPEAKVILVERDIDSWYRSWTIQKKVYFGPVIFHLMRLIGPLIGSVAYTGATKCIMGWIGSNRRTDIFDRAREAYIRHYREVREIMENRPGMLLELQLTDGWAPLCAFLDKDVPNEEFPRVNEMKAYAERAREQQRGVVLQAVRNVALAALVGVAVSWSWRTIGQSRS